MPRPVKGERTPGSGKPKGHKQPQTIQKEFERELLRQQVIASRERMKYAQIEHACGVHYMVLRHKDGSFTRATDVKQLDAAIAAGATAFEIFTQAPNPASYKDLMDRALDKPSEHVEVTGKDSGPLEIVIKKPW